MSSSESDCVMSDKEQLCTPPDIIEQVKNASDNLLPQKSKTRYENVYQKFMDWRSTNKIQSFSENVIMAYFGFISKKFKPSSLWAIYSMLRSVLSIKENVDIGTYPKLRAYLKRQSDGFKSKKSQIFTTDEVNKFLREAPDWEYLFFKVVLIIGLSGATRRQELKNLKLNEVEDTGKSLIITIPDSKTKVSRSFVVPEGFYSICKQYLVLREQVKDPSLSQFFLNYQRGRIVKQVVGLNKLGNVPRKIAEYLKLPNPASYTGHCLRRTSATILVDAGGDLMALKRHGGWKSSAVAEGYVDDSLSNKITTSNKIIGAIEGAIENKENYNLSMPSLSTSSTTVLGSSEQIIVIKNCKNYTINFNTK